MGEPLGLGKSEVPVFKFGVSVFLMSSYNNENVLFLIHHEVAYQDLLL